jgi:hypothetical protein
VAKFRSGYVAPFPEKKKADATLKVRQTSIGPNALKPNQGQKMKSSKRQRLTPFRRQIPEEAANMKMRSS